jgi:hypothetical protein
MGRLIKCNWRGSMYEHQISFTLWCSINSHGKHYLVTKATTYPAKWRRSPFPSTSIPPKLHLQHIKFYIHEEICTFSQWWHDVTLDNACWSVLRFRILLWYSIFLGPGWREDGTVVRTGRDSRGWGGNITRSTEPWQAILMTIKHALVVQAGNIRGLFTRWTFSALPLLPCRLAVGYRSLTETATIQGVPGGMCQTSGGCSLC